MHVAHLSLRDFRNYESAEVSLDEGSHLFVGRNGQGKTNLVESIVFISTLGSHRVSTDSALVRAGTEAAIVRARVAYRERRFTLEAQINRSGANHAQVNGSAVRPRELPRYLSSVIFAPEDLIIIRGDPSGRRRFVDELLVMDSPRLTSVFADYERVVKQRNTLLKSARASRVKDDQLSTLHLWDERLIEFGAQIMVERTALISRLVEPLRASYQAVAGIDERPAVRMRISALSGSEDEGDPDSAELEALSDAPLNVEAAADLLRAAIDRLARSERERGVTLCGPHRDDLVLTLNNLPVKGYASHGETWSYALALKLASAELLRVDSASGDPVLILDDVFAELDEGRRGRLAEAITGYEQVLITAAVEADVPESLSRSLTRIAGGEVLE